MKELSLNKTRLDGRYDIRSLLGRGSYAEIYTANDNLAAPDSPHQTVVIKALNVFLQNDLDFDLERTLVENFQNEAIALDRVRHPNVISRLGHGTARDLRGTVFHFLVLEYLSGGDLARACRQKSLTFGQALEYLEQICAGLAHAHKHGVIHRDIKPQNLLLTDDKKTVKIADFGVARVTETDSPITRVGTDIYAAPEHSPAFAGTTDVLTFPKLTPAADIYSLAKSAYVLFTCESPRFFGGQQITELPFAYRQEDWANDLLEIFKKATRKTAAERYQTVDEFWQDLAKLKKYDEADSFAVQPQSLPDKPQAHVAAGYSPLAPHRPHFNTSRELHLKMRQTNAVVQPNVVINLDPLKAGIANVPITARPVPRIEKTENQVEENYVSYRPQRKINKKSSRKAAILFLFLAIFAGSLFATYNYLLGRGFVPAISIFGTTSEGSAWTDVNLRPAPTSNNDPIGLVTKDSRVKILDRKEDWFKVEIIEQGRTPAMPNEANKGWVFGKYITEKNDKNQQATNQQ